MAPNLTRWIQLCDKKNLTFVDCCDKNFIKLAKGSFNNIFQDSFNKILSQQLTHDRSYIYSNPCVVYRRLSFFRQIYFSFQFKNRANTGQLKLVLLNIFQTTFVYSVDQDSCADPDIFLGGGGGGGPTENALVLLYDTFDFRISVGVSRIQEKSTFQVLTMRSPHFEPFLDL